MLPPLVDYAGERGVRLMIENCVMEGWHPDGYPGNLAYSPELWEWMFELGLWLNFDPSHLLWLGIDPVAALRPYVDRVVHAHAKDAETFPAERDRYGFFGRIVHAASRTRGTWAGGATASPASARSTSARYVDALYEGGFDGVLSVEHEDPVWGGTPEKVEQGLEIAHAHLRPLVVRLMSGAAPRSRSAAWSRSTRACKALQGVDLDVQEGEVHCLLGPQRRRQVDADQVRLGRRRADRRRDPVRRRAAARPATRRARCAAASRRSTRSSTSSRT